MAQSIDFLTDRYRQTRISREKKVWRGTLLVVFLSLIVLGTAEQRRRLWALEQNRHHLARQVSRMTGQLLSAESLRQQIQQMDARANLVSYLRLRVPKTRILAAVTNSLPPFVTLTEFRSGRETVRAGAQRHKGTKGQRHKGAEAQRHRGTEALRPLPLYPSAPSSAGVADASGSSRARYPAELDLAELKDGFARKALFVSLVGIAPDDIAISSYLASLQKSDVFDEVELLYTDEYIYRDHRLRSFSVRLRVKQPRLKAGLF